MKISILPLIPFFNIKVTDNIHSDIYQQICKHTSEVEDYYDLLIQQKYFEKT